MKTNIKEQTILIYISYIAIQRISKIHAKLTEAKSEHILKQPITTRSRTRLKGGFEENSQQIWADRLPDPAYGLHQSEDQLALILAGHERGEEVNEDQNVLLFLCSILVPSSYNVYKLKEEIKRNFNVNEKEAIFLFIKSQKIVDSSTRFLI